VPCNPKLGPRSGRSGVLLRVSKIHRGLPGNYPTDCSMVFRYSLCSITIRTNLQKLLDFAPPAPLHTYTGDWWPRSGLGASLGRVDATSTAITMKKWLWLKQLLTRLTPSPWSASYCGRLCACRFCPKGTPLTRPHSPLRVARLGLE
jgi:hypothetical protein